MPEFALGFCEKLAALHPAKPSQTAFASRRHRGPRRSARFEMEARVAGKDWRIDMPGSARLRRLETDRAISPATTRKPARPPCASRAQPDSESRRIRHGDERPETE